MIIIQSYSPERKPTIKSIKNYSFCKVVKSTDGRPFYETDIFNVDGEKLPFPERHYLPSYPENIYIDGSLVYHYSHRYNRGCIFTDSLFGLNKSIKLAFKRYLNSISYCNKSVPKDISQLDFREHWNGELFSDTEKEIYISLCLC